MSHTLGPWKISDRPRKSFASGELMYRVDGPEILFDYEDWGYTKESASLIAAAPELLEALRLVVHLNERDVPMTDEELRVCRAAIAKAEGEAK